MHNAFPITDIPGQRRIRVPTFDPDAVVTCPRCNGVAQMEPTAIPGSHVCPCGYIELAWMAYPSQTGNLDYVAGLQDEIARLRAGLEQLRIDHAIGREEGCVGACTCGAEEHNARIDALLGPK